MIDDKTISDAARTPGNEAPGSARDGVRPATKKAAKKTAKEVVKKTAKKAAKKTSKEAVKKTAKKVAKKTAKEAVKKAAKKVAKKTAKRKAATKKAVGAGGTGGDGGTKKETAKKKAAKAASAPSAIPGAPAPAPGAAGGSAVGIPTGDPAAAERAWRAKTSRPLAPAHAGAQMMGAAPEEVGGLGGFLALWGPLIIVGFLVLVFRGGDERESAAADSPGALAPASAMASAAAAAEVSRASGLIPGSAGVPIVRGFDDARAFPMPAAPPAWADADGDYPSPPGPYRNPGARGLPAGESWAARASEWASPAGSRGEPGYGAGAGSPPRWVRCAAPYYWCPAPTTPPAW